MPLNHISSSSGIFISILSRRSFLPASQFPNCDPLVIVVAARRTKGADEGVTRNAYNVLLDELVILARLAARPCLLKLYLDIIQV
jgi:hypothetical protein